MDSIYRRQACCTHVNGAVHELESGHRTPVSGVWPFSGICRELLCCLGAVFTSPQLHHALRQPARDPYPTHSAPRAREVRYRWRTNASEIFVQVLRRANQLVNWLTLHVSYCVSEMRDTVTHCAVQLHGVSSKGTCVCVSQYYAQIRPGVGDRRTPSPHTGRSTHTSLG